MLVHCRAAQEFARGYTWQTFLADPKTQAACMHALLIVGEAASKLPLEFRQGHPEIRWNSLINARGKFIHGYDSIHWNRVWTMVQRDMIALESRLVALLQALDSPEQL